MPLIDCAQVSLAATMPALHQPLPSLLEDSLDGPRCDLERLRDGPDGLTLLAQLEHIPALRLSLLGRSGWAPQSRPLRPRPGKTGVDALLYHRSLELREDAHHLEHCLARRGSGVDALLVEVEIHLERV